MNKYEKNIYIQYFNSKRSKVLKIFFLSLEDRRKKNVWFTEYVKHDYDLEYWRRRLEKEREENKEVNSYI